MSKISWSSADLYCYRFQPLQLFDSSETPDFALVNSHDLWYSVAFSIWSNITFQIKIIVEVFQCTCISFTSSEEVLHCFLIQQLSGKRLCLLTDLWPLNILIRRRAEVMLSHGLFSLLTERLMLHSNQFTMTTYNVLFEVSPLHTRMLPACAEFTVITSVSRCLPLYIFLQFNWPFCL